MAEFCKQCAEEAWGPETESDFKGAIGKAESDNGWRIVALCEGCGITYVNHEGECTSPDCNKHHGKNLK